MDSTATEQRVTHNTQEQFAGDTPCESDEAINKSPGSDELQTNADCEKGNEPPAVEEEDVEVRKLTGVKVSLGRI